MKVAPFFKFQAAEVSTSAAQGKRLKTAAAGDDVAPLAKDKHPVPRAFGDLVIADAIVDIDA